MMREDFLNFQAQTTPHPLGLEIIKAEGSYIIDSNGKSYLDFIAGVSACSLGHRHPTVVAAIKKQLDLYMHVMVYGEYALEPPVELAKLLATYMPKDIEVTYFTNSGTEAIEGAIKLAKRHTGRSEIIAADKAYHGNTIGAMSIMGYEERKKAFRPLVPDSKFIRFNNFQDVHSITTKTAAVVLETIQGGAGFIVPEDDYLSKIEERCKKVGTVLILDEIQPGIGRTGSMFGFDHYNCSPDIVVTGKGLGGGMPIGAFSASKVMMDSLMEHPKLGHITTFGGHPVICAAALATLKEIKNLGLMAQSLQKENYIRSYLKHPIIKEIRGKGLMLAVITHSEEITSKIILEAQRRGLLLFWLLFEPLAIRITPPLTITIEEIKLGCDILLDVMNDVYEMSGNY